MGQHSSKQVTFQHLVTSRGSETSSEINSLRTLQRSEISIPQHRYNNKQITFIVPEVGKYVVYDVFRSSYSDRLVTSAPWQVSTTQSYKILSRSTLMSAQRARAPCATIIIACALCVLCSAMNSLLSLAHNALSAVDHLTAPRRQFTECDAFLTVAFFFLFARGRRSVYWRVVNGLN